MKVVRIILSIILILCGIGKLIIDKDIRSGILWATFFIIMGIWYLYQALEKD